jgi:hypothetical protein
MKKDIRLLLINGLNKIKNNYMENFDKKINEAAEKLYNNAFGKLTFGQENALQIAFINGVKSEIARLFHTQGMFSKSYILDLLKENGYEDDPIYDLFVNCLVQDPIDEKTDIGEKEYTDNGEDYVEPIRKLANEPIEIRLYCSCAGCKQYIKGVELYNGKFISESGQIADLRNQSWICEHHYSL